MPKTSFKPTENNKVAALIVSQFPVDTQHANIDLTKGKSDKLAKADFDTAERKNLAKKKEARPDGSFPIRNAKDLSNAIHDVGRSNNPAGAKAWIKKRAKDLDIESELPDGWKHNVSKAEQDEINKLDQWEQNLEKGGEGSKGGKVIGHTQSGKPIYSKKMANDSAYKNFTTNDHLNAAAHHFSYIEKYGSQVNGKENPHYKYHGSHVDAAMDTKKAGKPIYGKGDIVDQSQEDKKKVKDEVPNYKKKFEPGFNEKDKEAYKAEVSEFDKAFESIMGTPVDTQDPVEKAFANIIGIKPKEDPIQKAFDDLFEKGGPGSGKKEQYLSSYGNFSTNMHAHHAHGMALKFKKEGANWTQKRSNEHLTKIKWHREAAGLVPGKADKFGTKK